MHGDFGARPACGRRIFAPVLKVAAAASLIAAIGAQPAAAIVIKPLFDSSITSRSNAQAIETAFDAAAAKFDKAFANSSTINITVSWGSVAGAALPSGDIGSSLDNLSGPYSFSSLVGYLTAASKANPLDAALASAVSHLPKTDPTKLGQFEIPYAEAKALGLLPPTLSLPDGYIGFNSGTKFDFNPIGGVTAGTYDFEGLAEHEIEEVLGRITGLQASGAAWASPFDLYRYSASGVSSFSDSAKAYFSVNGGQTNLGEFNISGGGDRSDWLSLSGATDIQNAFFGAGQVYGLSVSDLTALEALGWGNANLSGASLTAIPGMSSAVSGAAAAVPEPASWAVMLMGFGLMGAVMRRGGVQARQRAADHMAALRF
jgi:hypothetical protein